MRPFTGGHYRLSAITTGTPELLPILPGGEIHFGPGRFRHPFAAFDSYLRNAAHNPATIYHEFGHHICRHTADLRINAERRPDRQRNGKPGVEEGICDYVAASLLGSGRPYGWFRSSRGERRDPEHAQRRVVEADDDEHALGAVWAGGFWRCRQAVLEHGWLSTPKDHDRVVIAALLAIGRVGMRPDGRARRRRAEERCAPSTVMAAYLEALEEAAGPSASSRAARIFEATGMRLLSSEGFAC